MRTRQILVSRNSTASPSGLPFAGADQKAQMATLPRPTNSKFRDRPIRNLSRLSHAGFLPYFDNLPGDPLCDWIAAVPEIIAPMARPIDVS